MPTYQEWEAKHFKNEHSTFHRKGDITVQVWKDKRSVHMISTMHDTTVVTTRRKGRKTNLEIKRYLMLLSSNSRRA
jgi:hypothetical protein